MAKNQRIPYTCSFTPTWNLSYLILPCIVYYNFIQLVMTTFFNNTIGVVKISSTGATGADNYIHIIYIQKYM